MDQKAKQQLGELIVEQDKLLEILSFSTTALENYPDLQAHVMEKNQNAVAFRRAIRNKDFTKEDFRDAILERVDFIGYEICISLDLDFLINRVAIQVGDDIEAIKTMTIKELGPDMLSKLLHQVGSAVYSTQDAKPSYPWKSTKGQANPKFWMNAHKAFDLMNEGYSTHWKLNSVFKDKYDISVPQSFTRFARAYGDPRDIAEWREWADYSE
ncbi:hypothetical protein [Vibrio sp. HN007]|uniref:hypothetical protein n=1 Tax=Vibrio iocasae TaxID=3098914 RepID=UPI0035D446F3